MNPKEKSLREIIDILDAFAIKRTEKDKDIRHLIAGEQFEDLASAIEAHYKARRLKQAKEIVGKIVNSKIVNYAKKLGRYTARLQRREYDDPEDKWLKDKSIELAKSIFKVQEKKDR